MYVYTYMYELLYKNNRRIIFNIIIYKYHLSQSID